MRTAEACLEAGALGGTIERLIAILEQENDLLRRHEIASHGIFTSRKNQALRELMLAQSSVRPEEAGAALRPVLERLAAVLKANAALLKLHIGAVGEISDIIVNGIREAESDGTYGRARASRRF